MGRLRAVRRIISCMWLLFADVFFSVWVGLQKRSPDHHGAIILPPLQVFPQGAGDVERERGKKKINKRNDLLGDLRQLVLSAAMTLGLDVILELVPRLWNRGFKREETKADGANSFLLYL